MTKQQIIDGFHALYLKKIGEACHAAGGAPKSGLPVAELTKVFNETVAEYYVELLKPFFPTLDVTRIDEVDLKLWGAEATRQSLSDTPNADSLDRIDKLLAESD